MTRTRLALPALLLALAACAPVVAVPAPGDTDACGASGLSEFIGQDSSSIAAALFNNPIRIIRLGDMVTMDYNPNRINFRLDGNGRVESITCG